MRCRLRVKSSVWWPGVAHHIAQMVEQCPECARLASHRKEPIMPTPLPDYPWQVIGTDLFEWKGERYLVVVDYFSRYPESIRMTTTTSAAIIAALKSVFSRHGIPEAVRSDNGPQYASQEFAAFAKTYGFRLATSSPRYPQSNGQAERSVQTVKKILKKSGDRYILSYRATILPWCNLSPAKLLMGRRIRTPLPQTDKHLIPEWSYLPTFRQQNRDFKERQKDFDQHHRAHDLAEFPDDAEVWISSDGEPVRGRVVSSADGPRSYVIDTPTGPVHQNRSHLTVAPETTDRSTADSHGSKHEPEPEPPCRIMTRSQTGTAILPPERLA